MVLVVVGDLQKRSALQAEKADHFELGKTTAGLLVAILWPLELVGSRIGIDRQVPSTILTRRPSQSCWLVTFVRVARPLGCQFVGALSHRAAREPDSSRWYQRKASPDRENALATKR